MQTDAMKLLSSQSSKLLKNKALLCKPVTQTKATSYLLRKAFLNFIFYWLMEEMVIYFNPANLNTSKFSFPSHPSLHNSFLSSLLSSYLPNLIYLIVITALQGHSVLQHLNQKSWVHSVYFCLQMIVDGQYTK